VILDIKIRLEKGRSEKLKAYKDNYWLIDLFLDNFDDQLQHENNRYGNED